MQKHDTSEAAARSAPPSGVSRRDFLGLTAGAGATLALGAAAPALAAAAQRSAAPENAAKPAQAPKPLAPYRVWAGPDFLSRNPDVYAAMTLDAGGTLDPRVGKLLGKLALDTIDGTQTTNARGAYYWRNAFRIVRRTRAAIGAMPPLTSSGLAVRSWGGPLPQSKPENEEWMLEGLREGKKTYPDCFLAAWVSEPNERMFAAGRDGLVDLFIVEAFTHLAPGASPERVVTWERALARCDTFKAAGLLGKTIVGFGQIQVDAVADGKRLTKEWIGERARELKQRYPEMPGIAFSQETDVRTGNLELVRYCDALSAELWPDAGQGNANHAQ